MIRYYLKSAFRYLIKNRTHSTIHLAGLSIGFAAVLLISLFIYKELSYDSFHSNKKEIFQVYSKTKNRDYMAVVSAPLAAWAKTELPEVKNATKLISLNNNSSLTYKEETLYPEKAVLLADKEFNKILSFASYLGNVSEALAKPNSIVLTKTLSEKIFGKVNPIGKVIELNHQFSVTVNAILEDVPSNSSVSFHALVSMASTKTIMPFHSEENWGSAVRTFLQVDRNADIALLEQKILNGIKANNTYFKKNMSEGDIVLLNITDIYYGLDSERKVAGSGDKTFTRILIVIAIIIFLLAVLNFINLSSCSTASRYIEIGTTKTIGATNQQLQLRFLYESAIISVVASIVALIIVQLLLPAFQNVFKINLDYSPLAKLSIVGIVLAVSLLSGIVTGIIPAFGFSRLKPSLVLKGKPLVTKNKTNIRYPLVVFQFAASAVLIICSLFILKQIQFIKHKDIGFDKENIVTVNLDKDLQQKIDVLKGNILNNPNVSQVGFSNRIPGEPMNAGAQSFIENGEEKKVDLAMIDADADFLELYGFRFIEGENLPEQPVGKTIFMVFNESAAKKLDHPMSAKMYGIGKVTGIVKDFHFKTLHENIAPFAFMCQDMSSLNERQKRFIAPTKVSLKIASNNGVVIQETIKYIEQVFKDISPDSRFNYAFFDSHIDALYKKESQIAGIISLFTLLASFIAAVGLLGMTFYTVRQRTKEIGIRKVNGAKVSEILTMLNRDFIKWVAIAFVIACPIAYYAMNKWLENFAYKTTLSWWIFVLAGVLALGIALLTVSWQSWRAATRNPVEALRHE